MTIPQTEIHIIKKERTPQLTGGMFYFNLLGKFLQELPDEQTFDWYETLCKEKIFDEVQFGAEQDDIVKGNKMMKTWLEQSCGGNRKAALERLNIEHTRLMIGVGRPKASPYESTYFSEGRLMFQKQTMEVREWYRKFNLQIEKLHNEPDDHIGLELAFIGYQCVLGLSALEREDLAEYERIFQAQKEFLAEHPLKWMPKWCQLVFENAKTDFFIGLAYLVRGGLKEMAAIHELEYPQE